MRQNKAYVCLRRYTPSDILSGMRILKFFKSHHTMSFFIYGGAACLLAAALWLAYQYVEPAPPSKVTIASGGPTGAYYGYAREYAAFFAKHGIELEVVESKGSIDNLDLLADPDNPVDAAFVQGGVSTPEQYPDLRSLGSLYYEPLWIFHRSNVSFTMLNDLKGMRVAIGAEGSGTNHVVKKLLAQNGITEDNATLIEKGAGSAVSDMLNDQVDVVFFFSGVGSGVIDSLRDSGGVIRLFSVERSPAYVRSHRYLQHLVLPEGALDIATNLPDRDVNMLAPSANLVVNKDLHPAISYLFLLAAKEIHNDGDIFAMPGTQPNNKSTIFPLTEEAENYYKSGPPLLMRYMPYTWAVNFERLKIMLIPLLTLLFPLFKITPPAYRWQIRRRIFKWYKDLKEFDLKAYDIETAEEALAMREELDELGRAVMDTSVPLSYLDYIYSLKIHIRMIQDRLDEVIKAQLPLERAVGDSVSETKSSAS
ncbi:NMT1/THI5 like protein [Pseudodesulfovibrio profundus]|uniref:NMT1/THI5 like protein n=2 Tax=Pseudodesulfovibrio profundus TaxID=57320 RepID=A0A2C8F7X1_9BACT|nr:NMT1/THI5 like protein [Pseudodesulfovibrio profundus]